MTLVSPNKMHVKAEVHAENGELMIVVEFDTCASALRAVDDVMRRLTHEMDYSTLYWKRMSITFDQG
jgi:hypothetical protein